MRFLAQAVLLILAPRLGWAGSASPPPVLDWPASRNLPTFSGSAAASIPKQLKFGWTAQAAAGPPIIFGGLVLTTAPAQDRAFGTLSARRMSDGARPVAWAQDATIFLLSTVQPAAATDSGGVSRIFVDACDPLVPSIVYQAFDPKTGVRLWATADASATGFTETPGGWADMEADGSHEISIPFQDVVSYSNLLAQPETGWAYRTAEFLEQSTGFRFGAIHVGRDSRIRPVVVSGGFAAVLPLDPYPPTSVELPSLGVCQCSPDWHGYHTPVFEHDNYMPAKKSTPPQIVFVSATILEEADTQPFTYRNCGGSCTETPFYGPPFSPTGVLAVGTTLVCLGPAGNLAVRDALTERGHRIWSVVPNGATRFDANLMAADTAGMVVFNTAANYLATLDLATGSITTTSTNTGGLAPSGRLTITPDTVLLGDHDGKLHVFDRATLTERQVLQVGAPGATLLGDIAVSGSSVVISTADGTLVKLGLTGTGCDARSTGYPQNGHQTLGPGGVNTLSGNMVFSVQDLSLPFAGLSVNLVRTYNSANSQTASLFVADGDLVGGGTVVSGTPFDSALGPGWTHNYQVSLRNQFDPTTGATLYVEERGDGREVGFTQSVNGDSLHPPGINETFGFTRTGYALNLTQTGTGVRLRKKHGLTRDFDPDGNLLGIEDPDGNRLWFTYTPTAAILPGSAGTRLLKIGYTSATWLAASTQVLSATVFLSYDIHARLAQVSYPNPAGGGLLNITYDYDSATGDLIGVHGPAGNGTPYVAQYDYDLLSNKMSYHRDPRAPAGEKVLRFWYDQLGRVSSVRTNAGLSIADYEYASMADGGQQTTVTRSSAAGSERTKYLYDTCKELTDIIDPFGGRTRYAWDDNLNQISMTDANGHSTSWYYDSNGNVITTIDALGGSASNFYESRFNHVRTRVDANGHRIEYAYDDFGNLTTTTRFLDPSLELGEPAAQYRDVRRYDGRGLLVSATDARGSEVDYEYDAAGNLTTVVQVLTRPGTTATPLSTSFEYDATGRRTAMVDARGTRTEYVYDQADRLVQIRSGIAPTATPLTIITNEYDDLDRLTKKSDATGRLTAYTYDEQDRVLTVSDALGHTTINEYDAAGNRKVVTDPNGHVTKYFYDLNNRLIGVTDAENGHVASEYDPVGNLVSVTDPNNHTTHYEYDALNRPKRIIYPDFTEELFTYDAVGNRLTHTDARPVVTTNLYDSLDRLRRIRYSLTATAEVLLDYDETSNVVRRRSTVAGQRYTEVFSFDSLDRLTEQNIGLGISETTLAAMHTLYDEVGNRTAFEADAPTTPGTDLTIQKSYDALNRVIAATTEGKTTSYAYCSCGSLVERALPNGVTTHMEYDLSGRLTSLRNVRNSSNVPLSFNDYTYDDNGNRLTMEDIHGVHTYGYDQIDRLVQVQYPNAPTQIYTYDAAGNRLKLQETGKADKLYQYNAVNELTQVQESMSVTGYAWDPAGNLSIRGSATFYFDGANRLTGAVLSSTSVTYGYDPSGERVYEKSGSKETWFVYDGLSVVMELDGSKVPTAVLAPGISRTNLDAGQRLTQYFLYDGLGSVVQLTDELGNPVQEYDYDVFGATRNVRKDPFNRYRFVGLQQDDLTGLTYMNARWYEDFTGRFVGRDFILEGPGSVSGGCQSGSSLRRWEDKARVLGGNLYLYGGNSPVNFVDLNGRGPEYIDSKSKPTSPSGTPIDVTQPKPGGGTSTPTPPDPSLSPPTGKPVGSNPPGPDAKPEPTIGPPQAGPSNGGCPGGWIVSEMSTEEIGGAIEGGEDGSITIRCHCTFHCLGCGESRVGIPADVKKDYTPPTGDNCCDPLSYPSRAISCK